MNSESSHDVKMTQEQGDIIGDSDCFKAPAVLAPSDHVTFKLKSGKLEKCEPFVDGDSETNSAKITNQEPNEQKDTQQSKDNVKQSVPYKEPVWSGVCASDSNYALEILKNGTIIDTIDLSEKSYYVFGRQMNCDFHLEHPSISRHHAVLQYRSLGDSYEIGWYLYDLGSTHGTFVNKERLPPHMHVRIRVGYVLKFGGSTRMYILQGPDQDMEKESLLTVTEIKQRADKQRLALKLATVKSKTKTDEEETEKSVDDTAVDMDETSKPKEKESGINWGMTDDYADNEDDDEENVDEGEKINFDELEKREQFYIEDPKKALKNFFDREGVELKYEFSEKGSSFNRQWCCRIELPVETNQGRAVFAEVIVSGGKKEAYASCALEACRMLDAYGVLRKSNQESKKRKEKQWEDNDFYDSDEDTFLDRTGELERKREKRMRRSTDDSQVDNFESLNNKLNQVEEEIQRVQRQLLLLHAEIRADSHKQATAQDRDSLDNYMSEMSNTDSQEAKVQSSRLRLKISELKKEAERLKKLIKITKPTFMPPLSTSATGVKSADSKKLPVLFGSVKNRTLKTFLPSSSSSNLGDQNQTCSTKQESVNVQQQNSQTTKEKPKGLEKHEETIDVQQQQQQGGSAEMPKTFGVQKEATEISAASTTVVDPVVVDRQKRIQKVESEQKREKSKGKPKKDTSNIEKLPEYDSTDPDYAVWLPPDSQTGDGRTSLNEKLGY